MLTASKLALLDGPKAIREAPGDLEEALRASGSGGSGSGQNSSPFNRGYRSKCKYAMRRAEAASWRQMRSAFQKYISSSRHARSTVSSRGRSIIG